MDLQEKIVSKKRVVTGKVVTMEHWTVEKPNGSTSVYEVLLHPGASACLPLHEDGTVTMVRQDRVAIGRATLEIPAGKLEPGEDPQKAAARELEEETGLQAGRMRHLVSQYPAAAYDQEIVHIYLATELTLREAHPDEDEFVSALRMPLKELHRWVMEGKLQDSKTLTAILMVHELVEKGEV